MKFRPRRIPTKYSADIRTEIGTFPAEILDATETGARLQVSKGVYAKDPFVEVVLQGQKHPATIIWQNNGFVGVEFKQPLGTNTIAAVLRKLGRKNPEKKRRFLMR